MKNEEFLWTHSTFDLTIISESPTIEDFGNEVGMTRQEVYNLRLILFGMEQGDIGILLSLGLMVRLLNLLLSFNTLVYSVINGHCTMGKCGRRPQK